jgi:hypothetical protein
MSGDPVGAAFAGLFIAFVLLSQMFAWGMPRKRRTR